MYASLVCGRAVDMWRPLGCADSERFALVWESEELKALNNTLFSFVKNKVSHRKAALLIGPILPCQVCLYHVYNSCFANVISMSYPGPSFDTV